MSPADSFGFDMSAAAERKKPGRRRVSSGEHAASSRVCEVGECNRPGLHPGPKSPNAPKRWFCRKHAREYNTGWNFFQAERIGGDGTLASESRGSAGDKGTGQNAAKRSVRFLSPDERRALKILNASEDWNREKIRARYKKLVKQMHPDMNGGDRSQEMQLQQVFRAWKQIEDSRNFS